MKPAPKVWCVVAGKAHALPPGGVELMTWAESLAWALTEAVCNMTPVPRAFATACDIRRDLSRALLDRWTVHRIAVELTRGREEGIAEILRTPGSWNQAVD